MWRSKILLCSIKRSWLKKISIHENGIKRNKAAGIGLYQFSPFNLKFPFNVNKRKERCLDSWSYEECCRVDHDRWIMTWVSSLFIVTFCGLFLCLTGYRVGHIPCFISVFDREQSWSRRLSTWTKTAYCVLGPGSVVDTNSGSVMMGSRSVDGYRWWSTTLCVKSAPWHPAPPG